MKKTLSLIAVAGLLAVSSSVAPAQAETVAVAPAEAVSVPADAVVAPVTLEAVTVVPAESEPVAETVEAPAVASVAPAEAVDAPESVETVAVAPEPVAEAPVAPVVAPEPDPAELGYVQAPDGSWQAPELAETHNPEELVEASDGSLVYPDYLSQYEADLKDGLVPEVYDSMGHVQASDDSWVPFEKLEEYEAWLATNPEQPVLFGLSEDEQGASESFDNGAAPSGHTAE